MCYRSIIKHDLKTKLKKNSTACIPNILSNNVDEVISVEKTL